MGKSNSRIKALYTLTEAAALTGYCLATYKRYMAAGVVPGEKCMVPSEKDPNRLVPMYVIKKPEFDAWLAGQPKREEEVA